MSFNDKFLTTCFKAGKILFSVLLVVTLFISIILFYKTISSSIKASKIKIKYDYNAIESVRKELQPQNYKHTDNAPKENIQKTTKLEEKIKDFSKEQNLSSNTTSDLIRALNLVDNDKELFFDNFVKYYNSYMEEAVNIISDNNKLSKDEVRKRLKPDINVIVADVYNQYLALYEQEKASVASSKNEVETQRNILFVSFLISLGIFVLFLFLPILIRIEENTRK